ncbi:MAG: nitrogenase component 1 [Ruminococcus sp.]|nr:nitrogenase component 1 [Ruminococcus sp.]
MKKLLKHISPLAPDDSGACSVLYEMGGITVICDAGGCAGNVCGFDEPRWFEKRSALFSAGLRDMDAILGRDDMLVKKLSLITQQIDAPFTAIVGTPVPAVIATDLKALERMSEKKTGLPCIALKTDGTRLYDYGEEMAYFRLFDKFATDKLPVRKGKLGVIGATPLNTGETDSKAIKTALSDKWGEIVCFGMDSGLDEVIKASECERILVIAPSGIKAAKLLNERFGTPFDAGYPLTDNAPKISGKKVLIVHQQFCANALREHYESKGCEVTVASFFKMLDEYKREGDTHLTEEDELTELALNGGFDNILADERFKLMLKGFGGEFLDLRHFAVGGRLNKENKDENS